MMFDPTDPYKIEKHIRTSILIAINSYTGKQSKFSDISGAKMNVHWRPFEHSDMEYQNFLDDVWVYLPVSYKAGHYKSLLRRENISSKKTFGELRDHIWVVLTKLNKPKAKVAWPSLASQTKVKCL